MNSQLDLMAISAPMNALGYMLALMKLRDSTDDRLFGI